MLNSDEPARGKANREAARARMYRELVFETAEKIFAERGFAGAAMQDIATEAGISPRTLYATFPGKQELYDHILEQRGRGLMESVSGETNTVTQFAKLRERVHSLVEFLTEHAAFFQILLHDRQAWGVGPPTDQASKAWKQDTREMAEILEAGMRAGEFHRADPELLSGTVVAMIQSLLAGMMARRPAPDASSIADEIILHIGRLLGADAEVESPARDSA